MKKTLIQFVATILILSFSTSIISPLNSLASPLQNLQESEDRGYLILETRHRNLAVQIDNKFVGFTPLDVIELSPGLHKVYVTNPNRINWLDQDWYADVRISTRDTLRIQVIFKKSYSINSQPYGATVFFENRKFGETPIFFNLNEYEVGIITLTKFGYKDTSFTIGQSELRFFNITLKPQKKALDLSQLSSKFGLSKKPQSKLYLYSTMGLSLISGALALYFRNKGNSSYNHYLETGDVELMNKYLNDAKRFDKFAAVSFGVFQVSFVVSFYLFLKQANR
ncbi:MAG: PEGA domain-containing protein [bacterium]